MCPGGTQERPSKGGAGPRLRTGVSIQRGRLEWGPASAREGTRSDRQSLPGTDHPSKFEFISGLARKGCPGPPDSRERVRVARSHNWLSTTASQLNRCLRLAAVERCTCDLNRICEAGRNGVRVGVTERMREHYCRAASVGELDSLFKVDSPGKHPGVLKPNDDQVATARRALNPAIEGNPTLARLESVVLLLFPEHVVVGEYDTMKTRVVSGLSNLLGGDVLGAG